MVSMAQPASVHSALRPLWLVALLDEVRKATVSPCALTAVTFSRSLVRVVTALARLRLSVLRKMGPRGEFLEAGRSMVTVACIGPALGLARHQQTIRVLQTELVLSHPKGQGLGPA